MSWNTCSAAKFLKRMMSRSTCESLPALNFRNKTKISARPRQVHRRLPVKVNPLPSPMFNGLSLAYWTHDLSPFLIQFTDKIGVRYYGLAYVLGFIGGGWLFHRYALAGRSLLSSAKIGDFMIALVLGVM